MSEARLEYLRRPAAGAPEGALVLSHGRGTDASDLFSLLDVIDPERRLLGIAPQAPLTDVPPGGRHWYLVERVGFPHEQTFHAAYEALTATLDGILEQEGLGWEQTVLGGFSMGCAMSYAVGLGDGRPSPAAILALSGFIPTVAGWQPDLASRHGLPVLIHHGRNDPIIPVDFAWAAQATLADAGVEVSHHETDAGHGVPPELLPRMRDFVAAALQGSPGSG